MHGRMNIILHGEENLSGRQQWQLSLFTKYWKRLLEAFKLSKCGRNKSTSRHIRRTGPRAVQRAAGLGNRQEESCASGELSLFPPS